MTPEETAAIRQRLIERLQDSALDKRHDAASEREMSDRCGGQTAGGLMASALSLEAEAGLLEEAAAVLDQLAADLARLREERDEAQAAFKEMHDAFCEAGKQAEQAEAELAAARAENARLREALNSIANNSCCAPCREAALVARAALASAASPPPDSESIACRLHEAYERLAPTFGYETRRESAVPWEQVPAQNRALMIAVCQDVFGVSPPPEQDEQDEHEPGCPAIADDESDQVLYDYGMCVCKKSKRTLGGGRAVRLLLYCNSARCKAAEKAGGGKSKTWDGSRLTEHEYISSSLDKENGWKVAGIRSQGGCRDSAADYRTVRCRECGAIGTYDFATD